MDVISQKAKDFCNHNIVDLITLDSVIEKSITELDSFFELADKLHFLNSVHDIHFKDLQGHEVHCNICRKKPDQCEYKATRYFLHRIVTEIKKIQSQSESFDESELKKVQEKLDKILRDLELIKDGQEITYDDFSQEFSELKSCTHLGKKKWRQMLLGKMVEMTMSGIISQTVSKNILNEFKDLFGEVYGRLLN